MPIINSRLPELSLKAFHKGEFRDIHLGDYKGRWLLILFYPADFTFVCPTELSDLADHYAEFTQEGAEVFSVSTDTEYSHFAWHQSSPTIGKIQFPMLADPTGKFARALDVLNEDTGLAQRGTFIVDPDGLIKVAEITDDGIGRSAAEALRKLQAAKYVREHGEVCPANWKPGQKTLKPGKDLVGKI